MLLLFIFNYIAVLVFLTVVIYKFVKIASAPVHLRWELVPNEKGRIEKNERNHSGELKVMIPEILLLKSVREHNKELWLGSYPFHIAMYLFIGNIALFVIAIFLQITGISPFVFHADSFCARFWTVYKTIIDVLIWSGSILGIFGASRLLFSRIANRELAKYSSASHYFNIIFIGIIYFTALCWRIADGNMVNELMGFYLGLLAFSKEITENLPLQLPNIGYAHIIISLVFIMYLPFTHLTHFFANFFTYQSVEWDSTPNVPGRSISERASEQLNRKVRWCMSHIGADGNKNWIVIASEAASGEGKN